MKKLVAGLSFVLLLLFPLVSVAQFGSYTKGGFGVEGYGSRATNSTVVGSKIGYLPVSTVEIGGQLFRRTADDFDLKTLGIGPYLVYYPVRQEKGYPLSILIQGSYSFLQFSGDRADQFGGGGGSDTGNRYRLEIGMYPSLELSDTAQLLPYLGVSYALQTEADLLDTRRELTGLNFRLSFQYEAGAGTSLVVAPTAFLGGDDNTRFGLSAAFVF